MNTMDAFLDEPAIMTPFRGKNSPDVGPVSVLTATSPDTKLLCSLASLTEEMSRSLFTGKLYIGTEGRGRFSLAGPFVGAPYSVMVLETLIAWGARRIVFFGWCGAVSEGIRVGDIVVPTAALIDEGTSRHYLKNSNGMSVPSSVLVASIRSALGRAETNVHAGPVWTTDAVFRETRGKVLFCQSRNVLAVEMEVSALFTVAAYHKVDLGAVLVVSDELSGLTWMPGFKDDRFKKGRVAAAEAVCAVCREPAR